MRFETSVLTLQVCSYDCRKPGFFRGKGARNWACHCDICNAGWLLPERIGSRVMLVFSTVRVAGASRCLASDLCFAGRLAREKAQAPRYGTLWWWPEIVIGGES